MPTSKEVREFVEIELANGRNSAEIKRIVMFAQLLDKSLGFVAKVFDVAKVEFNEIFANLK